MDKGRREWTLPQKGCFPKKTKGALMIGIFIYRNIKKKIKNFLYILALDGVHAPFPSPLQYPLLHDEQRCRPSTLNYTTLPPKDVAVGGGHRGSMPPFKPKVRKNFHQNNSIVSFSTQGIDCMHYRTLKMVI